MTAHLHETDRILATLGEAIEKLRGFTFQDALDDLTVEVANDLALLHGAVSAEACRQEDEEQEVLVIREAFARKLGVRLPRGAQPKDIDVKVSEAGRRRFLRAVKDEEIRAEVDRGEHREGDWDA